MCEHINELLPALRRIVGDFDADRVQADAAIRLVAEFSELERLAVAGRTLAAGRVQQTRAWRSTGSPSAAEWVANTTGSTVAQGAATLNLANHLKKLPAVREAFVSGKLSKLQAAVIGSAAVAAPNAESGLLHLAERESVATLQEKCREVRAAAAGDEAANERIRRSRYLHSWNDKDGAIRLDAKLAPDDGAPLLAAIEARTEKLVAEARRAGQRESRNAHAADALVSLVHGSAAPETVVHVHVSQSALERGHTVEGETCNVVGVGPISVAAAKRLAAHGVVKLIETDGVDVGRIAHAGRAIPAHLVSALEARDPTCVVPGCDRHLDLEIDHIVPVSEGGLTELDNLARLCRWHHAEKTYRGWRLSGGPGSWTWSRGKKPRADDS